MSDVNVTTGSGITAEQFMDSAFREYRDKLVTRPYMGLTSEYPIQVRQNLTKQKGDALTFNLAGALSGSGVAGAGVLEGNEEQQNYFAQRVVADQIRNAVRIPFMSEQRAGFDLMAEAKPSLTTWLAQRVEQDIFDALHSINGVAYGTATEAQKDQFSDDNEDRVLYGSSTANLDGTGGTGASGNDHSDSLLAIDAADVLDTDQITLAKRLAQLANPKIRPIRVENGEEYYVLFAHPYCIRDLKATEAWQKAQREAAPRGSSNPIFTGMAGIYDGVIIKETPKALLIPGAGAAGIDLAMNSLVGAQGVLMSQAGTRKGYVVDMVEEGFDYDDKMGVAIRSVYGVEKAVFKTNDTNPCQHGVVSVFSSAVAD